MHEFSDQWLHSRLQVLPAKPFHAARSAASPANPLGLIVILRSRSLEQNAEVLQGPSS